MKIEEAKKNIKELENYIQLIESYQVSNFEQESVFLYVQMESVRKVAEEMNKKGYKVGNRKVISKDISDVIRSKPVDELQVMAKKLLTGNKKKSSRRGWM
ncbi:MAG: hypothetical protein K6T88_08510 [Bacillus sp. (in: Bacteria)]|nr:hypothetical protein [Bacillus sp. (in: firmicutes)]